VKYTMVFEKGQHNYAAYVPDLPGCVATGKSRADVERNIREAISLHLEALRDEGEEIPPPSAWTDAVEAS
jgi:predicted RNase H-like HicB family nuclease